MGAVLLRAASLAFIIGIGIFLKEKRWIAADAGDVVKKLMINITLPAAIIVNFAAIPSIQTSFVVIAALGVAVDVLMMGFGAFLTRRDRKGRQALYMLTLPAYNIGSFCLPFIQSFLPAIGSVTACVFDVGNSVVCTGGSYAFVSEYVSGSKNGINMGHFAKRLVTSPPLMTYVVMFVLSLAHVPIPEQVLTFISPISAANPFTAMLMLGLLFHLELKRAYLSEIFKILAWRYLFAVLLSCGIYFLLPFELVIRQTLVLVCFGPISAIAPAYTGMCGGDEGLASCANSISIIGSMIIMTGLIGVFGLF